MTPAQYREAIALLGLSQVAAGDFLCGNPRTSRRWASGESAVPQPVALLLRLMVRLQLTADEVIAFTDRPLG
jgi:hypothetical protein